MEDTADNQTVVPEGPYIDRYFRATVKTEASDLHLKVGQPAKLRIKGILKSTTGDILEKKKTQEMIFELLSKEQLEKFRTNGSLDFAYELGKEARFRVNIFRQRGNVSLVARRVNAVIPKFEELNLPATLETIAQASQGLVLVVGPTGSGKSTTIASMIDYINRSRQCHIVTIEDPIEYIFEDGKANVSQREVGLDVNDFEQALEHMMRQDPDVVFVGEMRDPKTVAAGVRAAETGHVVFATMHSANASQAIQRLLDLFPHEERDMIRKTLSMTLKAIISQVLLPGIKKGASRVPAIEILLTNPSVRKLIAEERESDLPSVIRSCEHEGMQDFTYTLCDLVERGMVDPKDAFFHAPNKDELKMALKGIRSSSSSLL